ncbi:hypothetical protein HPB52_019506 [Rhipicephalus sanguineus]|uniref:PLAC domain-containing protein n=1 Tax=Rhipicephalus sanguineus TaxID=34632 RepID=A0A9D4Q257_RHISA|nr:hypothetical protein HPB52_019506 [Rhipicephalus sanguineus]
MGHHVSKTLAKLVRDGTPCSSGLDDRVCIAGSCLPVGCDGVVSSRRIADLCGVCGGDNSTCRTFSGLLTLRNLSKDYEVITVIPRGAASLVATAEGNRLAVKDVETGRFILNGNASVWEPAGVYMGAGARFHYQNRAGSQTLEARGPLARPVHLMLVFRSPNLGVKFQYSVSSRVVNKGAPPSAPADEPSLGGQFLRSRAVLETGPFRWQMDFTCSKSCGTGLKQAVVSCVISATGAPVPEEYCSRLPRPRIPPSPPQPLPCNTQPCPADRGSSGAGGDMDGSPRWQVTSDWSACSVTCGDGLQRRTVVCVGLRGGALRDSACRQSGEKPPTVKPCKSRPCAVWQAGPWGKCSSECGKGMRKREVSCGPGLKESACKASEKPVAEQVCEMPPCSSTWFFSAWSECSVKCVPGVQKRRVFCVPGQNECDMHDKPSSQQPCLELCTGTWFVGTWSKRQVLCVGQQGGRWTTVLPDGHCGYTERPLASEPCDTPCAPEWHTSTWSACSTSCGGRGSQTRQSLCLDVNGKVSSIEACLESSRPSARRPCGLSACPAETAEERGCRDTRNRCALVVQARLCSYPYFRQGCCASVSPRRFQPRRPDRREQSLSPGSNPRPGTFFTRPATGSRSSGPKTARVFVFLESRSRCGRSRGAAAATARESEVSPPLDLPKPKQPTRTHASLYSTPRRNERPRAALLRPARVRREPSLLFSASIPRRDAAGSSSGEPRRRGVAPGALPPASLELRPVVVVVTESSALTPRCPDETLYCHLHACRASTPPAGFACAR